MIFLDMDGVLADFIGSALRVHGREDLLRSGDPIPYETWNSIGITEAEFWGRIDECGISFWADLEPYPWAAKLVEMAIAADEVIVATSPSESHYSDAGKKLWLQRNFRGVLRRKYMMGEHKHLFGHCPGAVLIDDNDHNIDRFSNCGGYGLIVPQPWNSFHMVAKLPDEKLSWIREGLSRRPPVRNAG
jgi:5'(3')-deoxyribonucleotidase